MSSFQRRTKVNNSTISSAKFVWFKTDRLDLFLIFSRDRLIDNEQSIPIPSRQGELNEQTDFAVDPSLIFDELPQPFRFVWKKNL